MLVGIFYGTSDGTQENTIFLRFIPFYQRKEMHVQGETFQFVAITNLEFKKNEICISL